MVDEEDDPDINAILHSMATQPPFCPTALPPSLP